MHSEEQGAALLFMQSNINFFFFNVMICSLPVYLGLHSMYDVWQAHAQREFRMIAGPTSNMSPLFQWQK